MVRKSTLATTFGDVLLLLAGHQLDTEQVFSCKNCVCGGNDWAGKNSPSC